MRKKERKTKSIRFYLCLSGALLGIYIGLVAVLAIRNHAPQEQPEEPPVIEQNQTDPIEAEPTDIPVTAAPTKTPEEEMRPSGAKDIDEYGRDGEQYTTIGATDTVTTNPIRIKDKEKLANIVGAGYDSVRSYINVFAAHEKINAGSVEMLDFIYTSELAERIEIYMEYDDEDKTLITVIYEPANASHSSHVDVVPCQYTKKEIRKKVWMD